MEMSRREFIQAGVSAVAFGSSTGSILPVPDRDLSFLTISELGDLIRGKKVSPVEVTRATLQRIAKLNPAVNAYITVMDDSAMKSAQEAEASIAAGKWLGPLHGVPVAVKDLFDTAGVRTTAASKLFQDRVPAEDAEVVKKLKKAGAIIIGKLNMQEFAYGVGSSVSHFGAIHNPWDLSFSPGGSSGGSAAALAAGLCFGALGSDTGGSVRAPASYCGIVGLKPTYGLISTTGGIPLAWSLDHAGPMARSVSDTAILLKAIAGYDAADITSEEIKVSDYPSAVRTKLPAFRLGIPRSYFFEKLHPDTEKAANRAIEDLKKIGANLKDVALPVATLAEPRVVLRSEAYAYHADYVAKSPELYQPYTLAVIRSGSRVNMGDYVRARREVARLRRVVPEAFKTIDVIVTPTMPSPAQKTEAWNEAYAGYQKGQSSELLPSLGFPLAAFNAYGLPTISVPCGFSSTGLPIGLSITGPHGGEAIVLKVAHAYQQVTDWHTKHPAL